jgi:hypothetical protein
MNSSMIVSVKTIRSNSIIGDYSIVATTDCGAEVQLVNYFGDEPKPNWVAEDYIGQTVVRAHEMVNEKLCRFFDPSWQPLAPSPPRQRAVVAPIPDRREQVYQETPLSDFDF